MAAMPVMVQSVFKGGDDDWVGCIITGEVGEGNGDSNQDEYGREFYYY